jgi:nicotinate-nucleotide adenylyltransferase
LGIGAAPPRSVGLLGGSFNPAHAGHRHVSLEALKRLKLDQIWWLVAEQNPLKPARGMAPLARRLKAARDFADHPRIKIFDLETRLGTRYTNDTVKALTALFPRTRFVWLMGADNLAQIRHWQRWPDIFKTLPVAVLARPAYCRRALAGLAAQRFAPRRIAAAKAAGLKYMRPPAWTFLWARLDPSSASDLRAAPKPARRKAKAKRSVRKTKPAPRKARKSPTPRNAHKHPARRKARKQRR